MTRSYGFLLTHSQPPREKSAINLEAPRYRGSIYKFKGAEGSWRVKNGAESGGIYLETINVTIVLGVEGSKSLQLL